MPIKSLRITHFRNLTQINCAPAEDGINLFYGLNGSGKTNLLEAIYYLGLGRSFRNSTPAKLIQHEAPSFCLSAHIINHIQAIFPVGIERQQNGQSRIKVGDKETSNIAELAYLLPIRVINSYSHQLLESGPNFRRKYLDWGLFYHSDQFLSCWRNFERVIKQRNTVLKEKRTRSELQVWNAELVKYHNQLDALRRAYIQEMLPFLKPLIALLLGKDVELITFKYLPGWDAQKDYQDELERHTFDDYRVGYTQIGAHRADFDMQISTLSAKHFLSRGQQKLLICAMILAQGMLLGNQNKSPIYLIDDLPAELDKLSKEKLLALLAKQSSQVFITAIESEKIYDYLCSVTNKPLRVFHVEHGNVSERKNGY